MWGDNKPNVPREIRRDEAARKQGEGEGMGVMGTAMEMWVKGMPPPEKRHLGRNKSHVTARKNICSDGNKLNTVARFRRKRRRRRRRREKEKKIKIWP